MIKHYSLTAAVVLAMTLSASAQYAITYVDATDGASGNTTLTNGAVWTPLTSGGSSGDGVWLRRAFGNANTIYESTGSGTTDDANRLLTTVTNVPSGTYEIYAYMWADTTANGWRMEASLTDSNDAEGQLPQYVVDNPGTFKFVPDLSITATLYSTNLVFNPFTTVVMVSQSNRRLIQIDLGQLTVTNGSFQVWIDDVPGGQRAWYDGVGYSLVSGYLGRMSVTNIVSNGNFNYIGTAAHQYALEGATGLNPPVTWTPLQTNTADSKGNVSFTNPPANPQQFYRVQDVTLPTQVIHLTATAGDGQVGLTWTNSAFAQTYNVKRATNSGGPYATIANVQPYTQFYSEPYSFLDSGLPYFITNYYVVSAVNLNGEGANSSEVSAAPFPPPAPPAPTGLIATAGDTVVGLSWTNSPGAVSYNVKSATTMGGPYTTITNVAAFANINIAVSSFVNTGLANGTTYYYVVTAMGLYYESTNSLEVNATPAALAPAAPTGLTASPGDGVLSLSWTASLGATSYNVKSATTMGGPYTTITNVTATGTYDTSVANGTTYYYVVSAMDADGEGVDSSEANATPSSTPPLVYSVENTGTNFAAPLLPVVPPATVFPLIQPLPDPFYWANDPLNMGGTGSTNFADWEHHRAQIKAEVETYEIGPKPVVGPTNVIATYSGSTNAGGSGTLTVKIFVGANSLTLTAPVSIPAGATAPYPVCIGMDSSYGSLSSSDFTSRGIVGVAYSESQVSTYGSPSSTDPYHTLYPAFTVDNTGQYSAWAWGVSRIIDGLTLVSNPSYTNSLPIDLNHICVTGCSYAGKLALFAGAFDERIALTIAQESGGGGDTSWRYSETEPAGSVEDIDDTDYNWFANQLQNFGTTNVSYLPEDHHELMAMCAPRALLCTGNTDVNWLSNPSAYVTGEACAQIYNTLGIPDRFGFYIDGGHGHCVYPSALDPYLDYFLDKFMLGNTGLSQTVQIAPDDFSSINYTNWTSWWGTTNPVIGGP
jgi:fibronectin type 3 domain-containing protein